MKRLFIYFIILLASVWLGLIIQKDPGYVLIAYRQWSMETTLWFAIFAGLVIFFLFYLLLRLIKGTSSLTTRFSLWSQHRLTRRASRLTDRGLCQLAEGEWQAAERNLLRGAKHSDTPLINYLAAAGAAQQQGHFEDRDSHLRKAHRSTPKAEIAIGLTQAQLQLAAKQWELALATLRRLQQLAPHQNHILQLLKRVYLELRDWESLQALLPPLRKHKLLKPKEYELLESQVSSAILSAAIRTHNPAQIEKTWDSISHSLQLQPEILLLYTNYLVSEGEFSKAEALLREAIKKDWSHPLVRQYGLINADAEKQLHHAESWMKAHGNDPELLLCLGRICMRLHMWDKARDYLQASAHLEPRAETYLELGQFFEQQGNPAAALQSYRSGLVLHKSVTL